MMWLASVPVSAAVLVAAVEQHGLLLEVFNNTASGGVPFRTEIVPELQFSLPGSSPVSAKVTGTLTAEAGQVYEFSCSFGAATFASLHVDDHLVCQTGANNGTCGINGAITPCNGTDNPLPTMSRTYLPLRLVVMYSPASSQPQTLAEADENGVQVSVSIASEKSPMLNSTLPSTEIQRQEMQGSLIRGWGAFYAMSYLDHILLPHGARVRLAICEASIDGKCVTQARIDWADSNGLPIDGIRLGPHSYDRSYNQLYIATAGCNISITASGGERLLILVESISEAQDGQCEKLAFVPTGLTTWYRDNSITTKTTNQSSFLQFESHGLGRTVVYTAGSPDDTTPLNENISVHPHFAYRLKLNRRIGLSSGSPIPLQDIVSTLDRLRVVELGTYTKFGSLAATKSAVQSAVMWQTIWNPLEQGPFAPVIRGNPWGLDKGTVNDDWAYVIFDWDNHFGSYMLSLDAKELGYSALIQVIKSKTAQGFIPNVANSVNKERHSQPPVGSKVLLEMYHKYHDKWIVELLFDDLFDWNNWFVAKRQLAPLNITCLGAIEGDMQDARYESGLDNSPMYDAGSCHEGTCGNGAWTCSANGECNCFEDSKMQLYDVGMASMHAMDSAALAQLASEIGRTHEAAILQSRSQRMAVAIDEHLWDDESQIYVNKVPGRDFYRRISPTSFYALQTTGPSDERADKMMTQWLMNSSRFCVAHNGDFVGNSDDCYWGLPSIQASDPAFPALGYWRGYVWGPMAQLTWWGLYNYDHVPSVRNGRKALVKQMNQMMLNQWHQNGYICENYFPAKVHDGCSPGAMHMYHWGALAGFISLLEEGYY